MERARVPFNSSSPGQNGGYFAHSIFECISFNEKLTILIHISLMFFLEGPIDNGLAPNRPQAITCTNAASSLTHTLGDNELNKHDIDLILQNRFHSSHKWIW